MGANYFVPENAWKRLFFITGQTLDEFYTDGGLKLNIEELTYLELKRSGYERVVFYDQDLKMYCYDNESYALLSVNGAARDAKKASPAPTASARINNRGMRRGKHAHLISGKESAVQSRSCDAGAVQDAIDHMAESANGDNVRTDGEWAAGSHSGLMIRRVGDAPLHLGLIDNLFVKRQIDAYMNDAAVKTAIVINDPVAFLNEFNGLAYHSLTVRYERLRGENENIIVFLYKDEKTTNVFGAHDRELNGIDKNHFVITQPNALELRNMLMYFRVNHGLKIRIRDMEETALAICQAMSLTTPPTRTKELYTRLKRFGTKKILDPDSCYKLLGCTKPETAHEQLAKLIGMREAKEKLSGYDTGENNRISNLRFLTSSRMQQDMQNPNVNDEMIHFVITGNSGTGKTTVAKLIGQLFYEMGYLEDGHLVETSRDDLVGEYVGHTAVKTREQVERAMGGVLFIDEAYSLKRAEDTGNDFGQEALDTLTKLMDQYRGKFVLVAAGYPREMETFLKSNPGLPSRFTMIHLEDYSAKEMQLILEYHAKRKGAWFSKELEDRLADFCENWVNAAGEDWGNAREAVKLVEKMIRSWKRDPERESSSTENGDVRMMLEERHLPVSHRGYLNTVIDRRTATDEINRLIGFGKIKTKLNKLLKLKETTEKLGRKDLLENLNLNWVLRGNPGTGKTTVAELIGKIYKEMGILSRGHTVIAKRQDLVGEYIGHTAVKTQKCIDRAMGGVLFIEEAYSLKRDDASGGDFGQEAIDTLLEQMSARKGEFAVIAAGYPKEMELFLNSNPGFRSRFGENFLLEDYNAEELLRIFEIKCAKNKFFIDDEVRDAVRLLFEKLIAEKIPGWANGREAENLEEGMRMEWANDPVSREDAETGELHSCYTIDHIPSEYRERIVQNEEKPAIAIDEIDSLIGFEEVKTKLKELLLLKETAEEQGREDLLEDLNLHWVLRGNPGTGKTTVAKLIGKVYKEMGLLSHGRTIVARRQDLVGEYVGHTAVKTQKCIDRAMGGVLFIDEAYSLKRAGASGNDFGQEAIDTILEQMSARNGEFAVIAAGYPREMEVFLSSNPGFRSRFDENFLLDDYTAEELLRIFEIKCANKKFFIDDEMKAAVKQLFENMISAKIKDWANGREAEQLEKRMRMEWAKHPVSREDAETGELHSYYTVDHIPARYKAYLPDQKADSQEDASESVSDDSDERFVLPAEKLPETAKAFNYEAEYLNQVKSVVYILNETEDGKSSGTGSIITRDGYILTCYHVVSGRKKIKVRIRQTVDGSIKTTWEQADVVWEDADLDMAILKIKDGDYPALALRPSATETITGESIYHWGYAFGGILNDDLNELNPSLYQGYVSSIQKKKGFERINTNMEAKRGCSGGPVFSKKDGSILGVLCGSQTVGNEGLVEEINYVRSVKYVWENIIAFQSEQDYEDNTVTEDISVSAENTAIEESVIKDDPSGAE